MQLVNTFDVGLKVSTFNAGDTLEWVPFKVYYAPAYSKIYVQAHDNGRCKVRVEWSEFGGRELGVHSEDDVVVAQPSPPVPLPATGDPVFSGKDDLAEFLRENRDLVRQYFFDLPGHGVGRPKQSPE